MSVETALRKAKALAKAGDFLTARELLESVVASYPSNKRARESLTALLNPKPLRASGDGPTQAEVSVLLALFQGGRFDEVVAQGKPLAGRHPGVAALHSLLGGAYAQLDRKDEAADSLARAIRLDPRDANAHNALGGVLTNLNRNAEAVAHFEEAVRLKPHYGEAHANLALTLANLGRRDEALKTVDKALHFNPRHAAALRQKAMLRKFEPGDTEIEAMNKLLPTVATNFPDAVQLHFALGKAHDDTGETEKAFEHFVAGNRIRRAGLGDVIGRTEAQFDRIKALFGDPPVMAAAPKADPHRLIFIVGMPRSGTTLVEQILASHSNVYGAGELDFMRQAATRFINHTTGEDAAARLADLRRSYLRAIERLNRGKPVVVDKMPTNFIWTGFALSAFPDATIVHTRRDPIATCWSIFRRYFPAPGLDFTWDLEDLAHYYRLYEKLMEFWHSRFPGRIFDLDYEELTESQEEVTRKLLAACDLDFEEACLDFHESGRAVNTASASQVRQKMYRGSSQEWRKYEKHLATLIDALGGPGQTAG